MLMILALSLVFSSGLMAQKDKIAFEKYGVAEGLPEEYVNSMVQDDQGFMWAATQNGLVKFDGYEMKVFQLSTDKLDSTKLRLRHLGGGLLKGKDGKIWIGGIFENGGIASFDPKTEIFHNYIVAKKNLLKNPLENFRLLFEDSKNNIWFINDSFVSDTVVVGRFDTKTNNITTYPFKIGSFKTSDILLNGDLLEFEVNGTVWLRDDLGNVRVFNRKKIHLNW